MNTRDRCMLDVVRSGLRLIRESPTLCMKIKLKGFGKLTITGATSREYLVNESFKEIHIEDDSMFVMSGVGSCYYITMSSIKYVKMYHRAS